MENFAIPPEQMQLAIIAPGQAALAGIKQLLKELDGVLDAAALDRVRCEVEEALSATDLPIGYQAAIAKGLR